MCVNTQDVEKLTNNPFIVVAINSFGLKIFAVQWDSINISADSSQLDITIHFKDNNFCIGVDNILAYTKTEEAANKYIQDRMSISNGQLKAFDI